MGREQEKKKANPNGTGVPQSQSEPMWLFTKRHTSLVCNAIVVLIMVQYGMVVIDFLRLDGRNNNNQQRLFFKISHQVLKCATRRQPCMHIPDWYHTIRLAPNKKAIQLT